MVGARLMQSQDNGKHLKSLVVTDSQLSSSHHGATLAQSDELNNHVLSMPNLQVIDQVQAK